MLTQAQTETLIAFVNRKWTAKTCQLCSQNNWNVHGMASLSLADQPGAVFGGPTLPLAAFVCGNCGNTVLVNLVTVGIVPATTPAPVAETEPGGQS